MYASPTAKVRPTKLTCFSTVAITFAVVAAVWLLSPSTWYTSRPYSNNIPQEPFMTVWPWLRYPPFAQSTHPLRSTVHPKQEIEEQVVWDQNLSTLFKVALNQQDTDSTWSFNYRICQSLLYDLQQWKTLSTTSDSRSELLRMLGENNLGNHVLLALLGANRNAYQASGSLLLYEIFDPVLADLEVDFSQLFGYIKRSREITSGAQDSGTEQQEALHTHQQESLNVARYWRKLLDISKKDTLGTFPDVKEGIEALADYAARFDDTQPPSDYHLRALKDAMYSIHQVAHEPSTSATAWEPYNRLPDYTRFLLSPLHYVTKYASIQDMVNLVSWVGQTVFSQQRPETQSTRHDQLSSVFSTYTLPVLILTIVAERGTGAAREFIQRLHQIAAQREWADFLHDSGPAYDSFVNYIGHTLVYQDRIPFVSTLPSHSKAARLHTSLASLYGKMYELRAIPNTSKYELYLVWSKNDYDTRVLWANHLQGYQMTRPVGLSKAPLRSDPTFYLPFRLF